MQGLDRSKCVISPHNERYIVLGRALADHNNVYSGLCKSCKEPCHSPDCPCHLGACNINKSHIFDQAHCFYNMPALELLRNNECSRERGIKSIFYTYRNVFSHCRFNCAWVEYVCPEVRELHSLSVGNLGDCFCFWYDSRVSGHDPVHFFPEPDLISFQGRTQNGSCEVRPASSQGGNNSVFIFSYKACDH